MAELLPFVPRCYAAPPPHATSRIPLQLHASVPRRSLTANRSAFAAFFAYLLGSVRILLGALGRLLVGVVGVSRHAAGSSSRVDLGPKLTNPDRFLEMR